MADQQAQTGTVAHFKNSLERIVELGYGEDPCEFVVSVMFEELVREVVPQRDRGKLSFKLPMTQFGGQNTYAQLHNRAVEVARYAERATMTEVPKHSPVVFPFMTTLGIAGGVFMLAVHVTRLMPLVF